MNDSTVSSPNNEFSLLDILLHALHCLDDKTSSLKFMEGVFTATTAFGHIALEALKSRIRNVTESEGQDEESYDRYTAAIDPFERCVEQLSFPFNISTHFYI